MCAGRIVRHFTPTTTRLGNGLLSMPPRLRGGSGSSHLNGSLMNATRLRKSLFHRFHQSLGLIFSVVVPSIFQSFQAGVPYYLISYVEILLLRRNTGLSFSAKRSPYNRSCSRLRKSTAPNSYYLPVKRPTR